ncbi:DUF2746 domain-containing protein [Gordonia malaquae]|uniref:DUF2746 domain-containing protein n=1 Tax=Gordonia malaquae TaxID=410332 RepID=UPI00301AC590
MTGPGNVDSWFEFVIWSAIAIAGMIGAVGSLRAARHSLATRNQVENDHSSNLRDDLDRLSAKIDRLAEVQATSNAAVARIDDRTARIGEEVRTDRAMRREADAEIRRDLAATVERTERVIAKYHPDDAAR